MTVMYKFLHFSLQLRVCPRRQCISTVAVRTDLFARDLNQVLLTDFFGSVRNVELIDSHLKFNAKPKNEYCM